MAETREDKIKFLKSQLTLVSVSLSNAASQIKAGKVVSAGMIAELSTSQKSLQEEIKKLENPEPPAPAPEADSALRNPHSEIPEDPAEAEDARKNELVERMIPRPYTMTQKALRQRKDASCSPAKAKAMRGNKNAWKTGQFAQGFVRQLFRPCLSSCPNFPCELIDDGEAALGHDCPDKAEFVKGLGAIQKAMRDGDLTDLKEIASLRIAGNIELLGNIQQELMATRGIVLSEKMDKDGVVIGHEMKAHPLYLVLAKLTEVTKMTAADFMMTPLEIRRQKTEAKKAKTMADVWSNLGFTEKESDVEVESE
jgi:hypothetical protein